MSKFDAFAFIKNRVNGVTPSDLDMWSFDLYMCNTVISMSKDPYIENILSKTNTMAFSRLKKPNQCLGFTSLDGKYYGGKWAIPKKDKFEKKKTEISRIMMVLECSLSEANQLWHSGNIDMMEIDSCYYTIFGIDDVETELKND